MRWSHIVVAALVAGSAARNIPDVGATLAARDDAKGSTTTTFSSQTGTSLTTSQSATSSSSNNQQSLESAAPSTVITSSTSSSVTVVPISSTNDTSASATPAPVSTSTASPLPLVPVLTPALAVGGVFLIITGLSLCFVGIKHSGLQIFISTALLVFLAIEVLIIYVINPPISNAVQGGYLVAGVIPGLIFGGVAVVFKEMTEGAGCFLGGFCFAMWLLCLSPGGLIAARTGRIILILAFSCAAWTADWSRYTRNYGIIVCTSVAGATSFVLGIDCFTNVGLKEFWVYLWGLNNDVFPLNTSSYPVTRNMQVEEACIIVVAVLGVLTQFQIWKILRAHRQKQDEERRLEEEKREHVEAERMHELEERNRQERKIWENIYGNQTKDSGIGSSIESTKKGGVSVRETEIDEQDLSRVNSQSKTDYELADGRAGSVYAQSIEEFVVRSEPPISRRPTWASSTLAPRGLSKRFSSASLQLHSQKHQSLADPGLAHSNLTAAISGEQLKHPAGSPPSEYPINAVDEQEDEDGGMALDEDDRASSVAATIDEDLDFQAVSRPQSQHLTYESSQLPRPTEEVLTTSKPAQRVSISDDLTDRLRAHAQAMEFDDVDDEVVAKRPMAPAVEGSSEDQTHDDVKTVVTIIHDSPKPDQTVETGSPGTPVWTADALPKTASRAVMNYRMNEWAKEAGRDAEPLNEPEITELFPEEPVWVDRADAAARARADENNAAPKPAMTSPNPEALADGARDSVSSTNQRRLISRPSSFAIRSPETLRSPADKSASSSRRQSNATTIDQRSPLKGKRRSMASLAARPTVESPAEETGLSYFAISEQISESAGFAKQRALVSSPSKANLLDKRKERIQSRIATTSFTGLSPRASTPDLLGTFPSDVVSPTAKTRITSMSPDASMAYSPVRVPVSSIPTECSKSPEDMTLAERKALLQGRPRSSSSSHSLVYQQTFASPSGVTLHRKSSQPLPYHPIMSMTASPAAFSPPHQSPPAVLSAVNFSNPRPARTSSTFDASKQAQIRSQWLSSHTEDTQARGVVHDTDTHMARMQALRQQAAAESKAREDVERFRRDQIDQALRMGAGSENHRAVLARMQSQAKIGPTTSGSVYPQSSPRKDERAELDRRSSAIKPSNAFSRSSRMDV